MKKKFEYLIVSGIIFILCLSAAGCVTDKNDEKSEPYNQSKTDIIGKYVGKNSINDSIVRIISVNNSPPAEEIYASVKDPNGTLINWYAYTANPGNKHPISSISHIDISKSRDYEDISWNDIYEDHRLHPDEEFFISKDIVPPDKNGYTFILENNTGKKLLEVKILPYKPEPTFGPGKATLEDLEFNLDLIDHSVSDGAFEIECSLVNIGTESFNISIPALGFPNLDFMIFTPEKQIIHYYGPYVLTYANGQELKPNEEYIWNTKIGDKDQIWIEVGCDSMDSYTFHAGEYTIYGIYTSDPELCFDNTVVTGRIYSKVYTFKLE